MNMKVGDVPIGDATLREIVETVDFIEFKWNFKLELKVYSKKGEKSHKCKICIRVTVF